VADSRTWRRADRYWASAVAGRFSRVILPAPPWMMIRGFIVEEPMGIVPLEYMSSMSSCEDLCLI